MQDASFDGRVLNFSVQVLLEGDGVELVRVLLDFGYGQAVYQDGDLGKDQVFVPHEGIELLISVLVQLIFQSDIYTGIVFDKHLVPFQFIPGLAGGGGSLLLESCEQMVFESGIQ